MKETDFVSAFSRARQAFKPATRSDGSDVDLSEECHDLVEYLRSELPLTEGHRLFLAAFFSGEALRARGGQSKSTGDPVKQAVASHYIARRSQKIKKESIYAEIMDRFDIKSKQTIMNYLNDIGKKNWIEASVDPEILKYALDDLIEWQKSK